MALALWLAAPAAFAQKGGGGGASGGGGSRGSAGGGAVGIPTYPTIYNPPIMEPPQPFPNIPTPKPIVPADEKCLPWNVSEVRDTAVSVTRLQIPSKARSEYDKACDSNRRNKFDEAEQHARAAIEKSENYAAAWVMLGIILEEEHKAPDAREACEHAMKADAKYVPAYLCRAEFSLRDQEWEQVSNLANLALGLNSAGDGYAYYYSAAALFHENKLVEARKTALQSVEIDVNHDDVPLYFLLAQIYDAEGQKAEAANQLRQILKHHTDKEQEDAARQYLAKLESPPQESK